MWLPFPENGVVWSLARTKPLGDSSATVAGSGVLARWFSTDVLKGSVDDPNVVRVGAAGQVSILPLAGLGSDRMWAVRKVSDLLKTSKSFEPMMMCDESRPSLS
jgi:hypothetical protein